MKADALKIPAIVILILLTGFTSVAQCFKENSAFKDGEVLNYQVYYNWGFIWINAGYVYFKVDSAVYFSKPVYHLDACGISHKSYDWLYKVRDRYQTFLDKETLQPLWFDRRNYEGGFEVMNEYFFDQSKHIVYANTSTSDRPFRKDTLKIDECSFDVISLVYYCRNLDFSGLQINDSLPITAIIDNGVFHLYIRYLGKEVIETRVGTKYQCIKFSALLVEGTIFKGGEDLFVWITDDKNRMPVLIDAKIIIGSVKVYLESFEGLSNPLEAEIK